MSELILLFPLFLIAAAIYSSVGFGGGSIYLALLVLAGLPYTTIPKIALVCNIIVVSGGLFHYIRGRHLPFERIVPFIITSIPFAYIGGSLSINQDLFLLLLGLSLAIAGTRLLLVDYNEMNRYRGGATTTWLLGGICGAGLGFLSGLVGIGGGIFLSPILYFFRWGSAREIAAMSSLFIFANSLSGLFGQFSKGVHMPEVAFIAPLAVAVFIGGQLGSRLSVGYLNPLRLQRITAFLVLFVSIRVFWMFQ